jgi:hypothetical protein
MATTLSAHEKKLTQLFNDEYEFHIPGYQRPYAWTKQEAQLVDDLVDFMRAQACPVDAMSPYFLGSIVLIKEGGKPRAEVVDGQQRLTTLTILLSALRLLLPADSAADLTPFIMQKENELTGAKGLPRLQVRDRDREFFRARFQKDGGFASLLEGEDKLPDAQGRMRENARLIHAKLSELGETERKRLAGFVLQRCFLVAVSTPDLESAYRIFSVMNSRGLDLSAADILKAELIGNVPEVDRDRYTRKWEDVEEKLGRDAFVDLLGHVRMVARKQKPKATLLKEFNEHVVGARASADVIEATVIPLAESYRQITEEAYSSTADAGTVNECLGWLNRLEFSDWIPPALAFLQRHGGDAAAAALFFGKLERLAYMMLVDRWWVNDRIDRFSLVTRAVEEGRWAAADSDLALTADERAATRDAIEGPVYETLPARARSTLLLRLDALLNGGGASYEHSVVTVEHVLPQNPAAGSEWLRWFPDKKAREARTHCLGNLALLTRKKNSAASNYEFARKKTAYFTNGGVSPFPLTTQVIGHAAWTPEVIDRRQEELVNAFARHWQLGEAA